MANIASILAVPRVYVRGAVLYWELNREAKVLCICRDSKKVEMGGWVTSSLKSPITIICSELAMH